MRGLTTLLPSVSDKGTLMPNSSTLNILSAEPNGILDLAVFQANQN